MKRVKKLFTIFIYIFVLTIILAFFLIRYFSYRIKPTVTRYVESEMERIITIIINDTISNNLTDIDSNSLFVKNDDNSYDLDIIKINMLENQINKHIENNIKLVSSGKIKKINKYFDSMSDIDYENIRGGVVYYIISGNLSESIFTNNFGPKIPIRFNMLGDTISNIDSKISEYGINNAMVEVRLYIKVNMMVYMPYVTKKVTVNTSMPLVTKIIKGSIPEYYMGNR